MKAHRLLFASLVAVGTCGCDALLGIALLDGGAPEDAGLDGARPGDAGQGDGGSRDAEADVSSVDAVGDASDGSDSALDAAPEADSEGGEAEGGEAGEAGCYPRPSGIASWWRAEGTAHDSVGPNDGTLSNVTFVPGVVGRAFQFAGDGGISADAGGLPTGANERTVEMWVRIDANYLDTPQFVEGLFFGYGSWGTNNESYSLLVAAGGTAGSPTAENSLVFSNWGGLMPAAPLSEGNWHHVAVTLTAGGTLTIYLDGLFSSASPSSGYPVDTVSGSVLMGGSVPNTDPCWLTGAVDEVTVYTRALDPAEIRGIFNAGDAGKCL